MGDGGAGWSFFLNSLTSHVSGHHLPADFFEKKIKISSLDLELTNEIARTLPIPFFSDNT